MDNKHAAAVLRTMSNPLGELSDPYTRNCEMAAERGADALEMMEWLMNPYVMFALVNSYSNTIGTPPDNSTFRAFCEARFEESKNANHQGS